jgi:hypothetical protein
LITAYDTSGIVTSDPIDSLQILLSKNNGFVEVFDLYTFPYHNPGSTLYHGVDYFFDKSAASGSIRNTQAFKMISFFNPTLEQLYDWNVGDIYEYSYCNGYYEWPTPACDPPTKYTFDTITTKNITSSNTQYAFNGIVNSLLLPPATTYLSMVPRPYIYSSSFNSGTYSYDKSFLVDTSLMPEEFKQ